MTPPTGAAALAELLLVCSACGHLWSVTAGEWDGLGATGCPRCGGWTWLAQLSYDAIPAQRGGS